MSIEVKGLDAVLNELDNAIGIEKVENNVQKACLVRLTNRVSGFFISVCLR